MSHVPWILENSERHQGRWTAEEILTKVYHRLHLIGSKYRNLSKKFKISRKRMTNDWEQSEKTIWKSDLPKWRSFKRRSDKSIKQNLPRPMIYRTVWGIDAWEYHPSYWPTSVHNKVPKQSRSLVVSRENWMILQLNKRHPVSTFHINLLRAIKHHS